MVFEVVDMSCGGCVNTITNAVMHLDPAATLETDVTTKIVGVDSTMPEGSPVAAIKAAGFHPAVNAQSYRPMEAGRWF